jgi:GDP-4-dehydro-6-deoxy-D-mannose reductase
VLIIGSAYVYRDSEAPLTESDACGPLESYGFSKLFQELIASQEEFHGHLDVVVARTFNAFGPGQSTEYVIPRFASQIAGIEHNGRAGVLEIGNVANIRDFLDVRDAVSAYRLLAERGVSGGTYNVCTGEGRPVQAVLDSLLKMTTAEITLAKSDTVRRGDRARLVGDPSRLHTELGWAPQHEFETSVAVVLQDWRSRGA